jgi:hypothetical protein
MASSSATSQYWRIVAILRVMRHRLVPVIQGSLRFIEGASQDD